MPRRVGQGGTERAFRGLLGLKPRRVVAARQSEYLVDEFTRAVAESFAERVRARFGPRARSVIAFGSRARGDARPDSDLDLLVLLDAMSLADRNELSDLGYDLMLEKSLPFPVNPTVMTEQHFQWLSSLERLFPREIARDGIEL